MRRETKSKMLKSCATILLLWVGGMSAANALIIKGKADPTFDGGGGFDGITWNAEIQFTDSDASCVSGTNANAPSPPGHGCLPDAGTLSITGSLSDGTNTAILNFLTGPDPSVSITTSGGVATAIQTGIVGPTAMFTLGSLQGFAWIDFEFGTNLDFESPSAVEISLQSCGTSSDISYSYSYWHPAAECAPIFENAATSSPDSVTVTQTPEPGMLWLLALGAMTALGFTRRRALSH
jgi:hypothetical protein